MCSTVHISSNCSLPCCSHTYTCKLLRMSCMWHWLYLEQQADRRTAETRRREAVQLPAHPGPALVEARQVQREAAPASACHLSKSRSLDLLQHPAHTLCSVIALVGGGCRAVVTDAAAGCIMQSRARDHSRISVLRSGLAQMQQRQRACSLQLHLQHALQATSRQALPAS